jgi:hypothetical protein
MPTSSNRVPILAVHNVEVGTGNGADAETESKMKNVLPIFSKIIEPVLHPH